MPNVSLYLKLSSVVERKGAREPQRKTKGEIDLEKVSSFAFLRAWWVFRMCVNASAGCCLIIDGSRSCEKH